MVPEHEHPLTQGLLGGAGAGHQVGVGGLGEVTGALHAALGGAVGAAAQREQRQVDGRHGPIVGAGRSYAEPVPPDVVHSGLLRSATDGLVDSESDGVRLRFVRHGGWLDLLDRYKLLLPALMIVSFVAAALVEPPLRTVLLAIAAGCLLALVLLVLLEVIATVAAVGWAVTSLLTRAGRRQLRVDVRTALGPAAQDDARLAREVPLADVRSVEAVRGVLRPRLVLHTNQGELSLSTWGWRRSQLRRLEHALRR